jgi:hypothetical protein
MYILHFKQSTIAILLLNIKIYVLLVCTDGGNTYITLLAQKLFLWFVSDLFLPMSKTRADYSNV